jgi:hypothetical protein
VTSSSLSLSAPEARQERDLSPSSRSHVPRRSLIDDSATCLPSERLGPGSRLLRPLAAGLNRP